MSFKFKYKGLSHSTAEKTRTKTPSLRGKKIETLKTKRNGLKSEPAHSGGRHYFTTTINKNGFLRDNFLHFYFHKKNTLRRKVLFS